MWALDFPDKPCTRLAEYPPPAVMFPWQQQDRWSSETGESHFSEQLRRMALLATFWEKINLTGCHDSSDLVRHHLRLLAALGSVSSSLTHILGPKPSDPIYLVPSNILEGPLGRTPFDVDLFKVA